MDLDHFVFFSFVYGVIRVKEMKTNLLLYLGFTKICFLFLRNESKYERRDNCVLI